MLTGPCHSPQAQRSAPEAKGVSQVKVQAACRDRKEELEKTALPEGLVCNKKISATARAAL